MKKHFVIIISILLLSFIMWYFSPISLNTIINNHIDIPSVERILIDTNRTVFSQEVHEISENSKVNDVISIINDITVRRQIRPTSSYTFKPKLYDTFYIMLITNNIVVSVDFMDKNYVIVGGRTYKINEEHDLKIIYDIVNE